jgi:hypothetical protein
VSLEVIASGAGVGDVFVLHQVVPGRLVNVDGHGRGKGWAGNIDVDPATEPWLVAVRERGILRTRHGMPHRVFGPYWSREAAGVAVGDHVVVFGGDGAADLGEAALWDAARAAVEAVDSVPLAKRLADDLEVAQAALSVAQVHPGDVGDAARAVATAASRATSCEFGAVLLHGPPITLHLAEEGWRPSGTDEEIITALLPLAEVAAEGPFVEQDTTASPFPYRPLSFEDGLVARCTVPLGERGRLGLLVVAHSVASPRGFTMLCQRVMGAIAESAAPMLEHLLAEPA